MERTSSPAETLLAAIFSRVRDAILIADDRGQYVEVSPSASELTGFSREELLRMKVSDLTPPPDRDHGDEMWRAFQAQGELGGEYRLTRKDGRVLDVEFRAVARVAPGLHLSTLRDVTERKELERQRERLLAAHLRLIGVVGHDLRNPLGAILAATALLEPKLVDERALGLAHRIQASTRRMGTILNDLLDFVREEAGRGLVLSRVPTDANEVAREAIDELRAARHGARIELQAEGTARGVWDPSRLQQVVSNLVGNALQHGAPGETVTVKSHMGGDGWELSVHNQGAAIPPETLRQIFEPFRSGPPEEPRSGEGLGLGLYIVQAIVTAHGGGVTVTSDAAAGTTFTVRMPAGPPGIPSRERAP